MQTGMYAISEMASLFNVSRQTLIYYDKIGLFKPAVVNERLCHNKWLILTRNSV